MTIASASQWNSLQVQDEDEKRIPPARTPGQAEGENGDVDPNIPRTEPIRRDRPSQAEGEDPDEQADEVPADE